MQLGRRGLLRMRKETAEDQVHRDARRVLRVPSVLGRDASKGGHTHILHEVREEVRVTSPHAQPAHTRLECSGARRLEIVRGRVQRVRMRGVGLVPDAGVDDEGKDVTYHGGSA
jgi:hypothetical protein